MAFTIPPNRYVLGGNAHLPGKSNSFLDGSSLPFTIVFPDGISTDEAAIAKAEEIVARERSTAKPGFQVGATLYFNERVVENFLPSASSSPPTNPESR